MCVHNPRVEDEKIIGPLPEEIDFQVSRVDQYPVQTLCADMPVRLSR